MAITSLDQYIAGQSQRVTFCKTASRTSVAVIPFSVFDLAGNPSAGTLAVGNTANGIVPTDTLAGYPTIDPFSVGTTGYLTGVQFGNTVASRITIFDCLFSAGAYSFNSNVVLASQPSYASRIPVNGYKNTEIWFEAVTAFTGNPSIAVTYTNQDGVTGRTTGTIATGVAPTVGRMIQLPLQSGDTGVQKIESVVATVATVGTFNIHVMRRLWQGRCRLANDGDAHDMLKTGMPQVFDDSALRVVITADGTATGIPELQLEITSG